MRLLLIAIMSGWPIGLAPVVSAQVLYGSLVGTVTDPSGALIPGAQIRLQNIATNQTREAQSNEAGAYAVSNLLAGTYEMEVKATGFRTLQRTGIDVVVNSVRREDIQLQVGQVSEEVTVAASAAPLKTERADVSVEIGASAMKNLPIGGYRNYQSLINLVPGATPGQFQNAAISRPGRALTTNVNGTNRNNNTTKLDGAVNMSVWLPHHVAYVAPTETIETVNVATNNFDAEQGMAGGAAVTVVTKSGTNELHGSVFAYHDNQHLRARGFFERLPQKPKSIRNIDGFTIGGPIAKNRLFFFGGWESSRERTSRRGLFTLPTEDQRRGDFSAYNTTIYDPGTGTADGRSRTPFANNIVPGARQSAISRKIQGLIPAPNQAGISANFYGSDVQQLDRDQADVKINWNRTASHTLWAKYSIMNAPASCNPAFGEIGGPGLCDVGSGKGDNRAQLSTIGHTWVAGPSLVVDGTLGYTRNRINVTPPGYGRNTGLELFGIPGTNGPDIRQSGTPIINIGGYTSLGDTDGWNPAFQRDQTYAGTSNVGWTHGVHDVRFGFEVARHQMNHWQPELGSGPRGGLAFGFGPWQPSRLHATEAAARYCRTRYSGQMRTAMQEVWPAFLRVSQTQNWAQRPPRSSSFLDPQFRVLTTRFFLDLTPLQVAALDAELKRVSPAMEAAAAVLEKLATLAPLGYTDELWRRDALDMARTCASRALLAGMMRGSLEMEVWRSAKSSPDAVRRLANITQRLLDGLGDVTAMSDDFSMHASLERLRQTRPINPHSERTLKSNAENNYCRGHHDELVRHLYAPELKAYWDWVLQRMRSGDRSPWTRPEAFNRLAGEYRQRFYSTPLADMNPRQARSAAQLTRILAQLGALARELGS